MINNIFIQDTYEDLYFVGDIHGNFRSFMKNIENYKDTCFIICGDIGIGFSDQPLRKLQGFIKTTMLPFLQKRNNKVFCIRGNHDNPEYFKNNLINNDFFKLVDDYTVITYQNNNILCIGGGLSIDRIDRTVGKSYWTDEMPVFDKNKIDEILSKFEINIIATHTAPSFVAIKDKGKIVSYFLIFDKNLQDDLKKERKTMDDIYNYIIQKQLIKCWYYGHFHGSFLEQVNNTTFIGLNIEEMKNILKVEV